MSARGWLLCLCLSSCAATEKSVVPSPQAARHGIGVGDRAPGVDPGKVTLVVFWATWSEPSKREAVKLEEVWRRKKDRAFTIKAWCIDDDAPALDDWRKTYGLTYPSEWDRDHRAAAVYGIPTSEAVYVVDRSGIVRFVHVGYHDQEEKEIEAEIDSLL